jgi:hypothetical protein
MYYFVTLEEMLVEALRFATEGSLDQASATPSGHRPVAGRPLRLI